MGWDFEATLALGGIGLLVVALVVTAGIAHRDRTADRHRLDDATRWIEVQLKAEESVRKQVSLELHDNILQRIYGLTLDLQHQSSPSNATLLTLQSISEDVRHIAHGLYPPAVDVSGLPESIGALVDDWSARSGIRITYECAVHRACSRDLTMPVYRVIQEALNNAVTHGYPNTIHVSITEAPNGLAFHVTDNGVGFDVNDPDFLAGLGLLSMQSRLRWLGGSVEVVSRPGAGTTVRGWVPWGA